MIHRATGSIGRRYARADEIGVAYCITVDFDTQKDNTVTLRFRNDGRQVRVPINRLYEIITLFTDNDVRTLGGSKKVEEFPVVK